MCFSAIPSSRLARLVFAGGDPSKEGVLHQQGAAQLPLNLEDTAQSERELVKIVKEK